MSDRRNRWVWLLVLLLLALAVWALAERRGSSRAEAQARAAQTVADRLVQQRDSQTAVAEALAQRYDADTTAWRQLLARWQRMVRTARGTVDTAWMPGTVDTVPVPVGALLAVADSTIRACEATVTTCEQRVAIEAQRTATERERGDSLQSAATNWKRVARGPFIGLAVEGTLTTDFQPQAAGEVTLGRGKLRVLGRVEVGEGAETCSFAPTVEAYTCSTPVEATVRFGARWVF